MKNIIITISAIIFSFGVSSQNIELINIAKEDQMERMGNDVKRTDEERRKLVLQLIAKGKVITAQDKFNAALVLQHTGLKFCDGSLVSSNPENYLLAHYLFKAAFEDGYEDARYLVAASIDRYLSFTKGYQRYGTNRVINQKTGIEELIPIDRQTTDKERKKYGVPSLEESLAQYPEQK